VSLICASSAAVVSATATYPIDLVRRRLQMRCAKDRGQTFVAVFQAIFKSEGFMGFYRGIIPEYAKAGGGIENMHSTDVESAGIGSVSTARLYEHSP